MKKSTLYSLFLLTLYQLNCSNSQNDEQTPSSNHHPSFPETVSLQQLYEQKARTKVPKGKTIDTLALTIEGNIRLIKTPFGGKFGFYGSDEQGNTKQVQLYLETIPLFAALQEYANQGILEPGKRIVLIGYQEALYKNDRIGPNHVRLYSLDSLLFK